MKLVDHVFVPIDFDNGTGYVRKLYVFLMSRTNSIEDKPDKTCVDGRFLFDRIIANQIEKFHDLASKRRRKVQRIPIRISRKRHRDKHLKTCSDVSNNITIFAIRRV